MNFTTSEIFYAAEKSGVKHQDLALIPFDAWPFDHDKFTFIHSLLSVIDSDDLLEIYSERDLFIDSNMKVINISCAKGSLAFTKNFCTEYAQQIQDSIDDAVRDWRGEQDAIDPHQIKRDMEL